MKGFTTAACFALAGTLLATSTVMAQARNEAAQPRTTTTATQGAKSVTVDDRALAGCVAIGNQTEVAVTQFAKDKLQDEDVKKFAEMLIKDHQEFLQKLQKFTPEANRANWLETKADSSSGVQQAGGAQPAGRQIQQTSATSGQGADFLQIRREIAQECLASAKKKLTESKDKDHTDKCFLGMQAGAHMAMISELTVLHRHTSGELQQILADGKESAQKHLEKAEALMKDLAHDSDSNKKSKANKED